MSVATGGAATGMAGLPEVWQWQEQLVGFGTRYTGSSGHAAYVDWLAGQLSTVLGFRMRTDRLIRRATTPSHGPTSAQIAGVPTAMTVKGCAAAPPTAPGTTIGSTIMSGGVQRSYLLHVPVGYHAGEPYPLILAFHGRDETPELLESYSDLDSLPAIIAYPQGLPGAGGELAWESTPYAAAGVNDVAFTAEVIDAVEQRLCVDPSRVYATGKSDGGGFAVLLACTMSDRIAAVAPVAGAFYEQSTPCNPVRAVPVLNFHGTGDTVIPYDGVPCRHLLSVPAWLDGWARLDGCANGPEVFYRQADVVAERWNSCQQGSTVVNYRINGGGHTWPGAKVTSGPGITSHTVSATALMGQFFSEHPLPEPIVPRP